jgi:O-succinylbenzoic acid--CoA ligase
MFHPKARLMMDDVIITHENYRGLLVSNPFTEDWNQGILLFLKDFLNESPQIELSTSGTTGQPKKSLILKEKMLFSAYATGRYFNLKPEDTALLSLSSSYIAAKMMVVRALALGLTLFIVKPSSNPLLDTNLPEEIDFAPFVPLQISSMIHNDFSLKKLIKISQIIIGGSNVNYLLTEEIKKLPNKFFETFGMTETLSHVAIRPVNDRQDTAGAFTALPGITFETDNRNCLVINAPELLDSKLITNDVVELTNPVSFFWKGRFDNMINSGGIKINPEVIEKQLEPFIKSDYFVGSVPDDQLGEKMVLIIEDLPNNLHLCKLFEQMNDVLPKYHIPREVYLLSTFHRNNSGKILRKEIVKELLIGSKKYQVVCKKDE